MRNDVEMRGDGDAEKNRRAERGQGQEKRNEDCPPPSFFISGGGRLGNAGAGLNLFPNRRFRGKTARERTEKKLQKFPVGVF
jgi:hypothetical protein